MSKYNLDELDINNSVYQGFIRKAELMNSLHMPGPDTIISLQFSQSLKDIFVTIMNGLYMMKDGIDTVYVNIIDKCIKVSLDKYGVPDKSDMLKLYSPFSGIFKDKGNGAFVEDLDIMLNDINSGKFVYEE